MKTSMTVPAGLTVVGPSRGGFEAVRSDGLRVFLDGDHELDQIRATGTREQVIAAVALRAAQRIALGYARKHAPDLVASFDQPVRTIFSPNMGALENEHEGLVVTDQAVRCVACERSLFGVPVETCQADPDERIAWCPKCGAGVTLAQALEIPGKKVEVTKAA